MNCFFLAPHPESPLFPRHLPLVCCCAPEDGVWLEHGADLSNSHYVAWFSLFTFFGSIDCFPLALAPSDHCVTCFQPLLYVTIKTQKARLGFEAGAYVNGVFSALGTNFLSPKYSSSFCPLCHYDADLIMLYCNLLLISYHSSK